MKIVTIVGARPQFIKASPVNRAIKEHNRQGSNPHIIEVLVHTGQHYDYNMSHVFFDQLQIPEPNYHLGVGSHSHGKMTGMMLVRIEEVLLKEKPNWVLVYGDTNSTLAGALAAVKLHMTVAHIEAGLRSFNRHMPEEINRVITDHISSILFCPTETAVNNLKKEGFNNILTPTNSSNFQPIESEDHSTGTTNSSNPSNPINLNDPIVLNVGDVMYDAFLCNKEIADTKSQIVSQLNLESGSYCLATVHRQENTEDSQRLLNIFTAFEELATSNCPLIVLLHPRTKNALQKNSWANKNNHHVQLLPPVSYLDMIALEANAKAILTDSGGVQKEAYFAQVPCVTLREETEWLETVRDGWNFLAGADPMNILSAFEKAMDSPPRIQSNPFGNGNATGRMIAELISRGTGALAHYLNNEGKA